MADRAQAAATRPITPRGRGRGRLLIGAAITLAVALVALATGQKIWSSPAGSPMPPAGLLPLFIALEAITDVLLGLGVCFVLFGYRRLAGAGQPPWLTYATYVSIAWLMVSWWPHGNLHRITPPGAWYQLLLIDYGFHLSLMIATGIVALFFLRSLRGSDRAR